MATRASDITFIVPGQPEAPGGSVKAAVRVGAQRGGGDVVRLTARPGDDVVVLKVAGGPTLVLHPQDALDLLRSQNPGATRSAAAAAGGANEVTVSPQLGWEGLEAGASRGATRGWLGQTVLAGIDIITKPFKDQAASLAGAAITKKVDGAVDEGVYQLSPDPLPESLKGSGLKLDDVPPAADGGPLLVLVHGTFVDTISTFGKLWTQHPQAVRDLFGAYQGRVYALDHPTMGESPITNALALVKALPAGARLHLVTHSRGGLVAEVLARACGAPLTDEALALFGGADYAVHRADLQKLVKLAQGKGLKVEKVVRVACPARGTLLASTRLDAYLSVLQWGLQLAGIPVVPQLVDLLHEVARRRAKPDELPGIEAMMPDTPIVKWLNDGDQTIPGELRVIAGDMQGDSVVSWVKTLLTDAFYWTDNDIVVQTRSMYGGTPRAAGGAGAGASFLLDRGANVSHFNYFANDRTVGAIVSALTNDAPADFETIGPLSWAGQDASGTRAARAVARSRGPDGAPAADKPAVFVLPGILGSNLKLDGHRIWLGVRFINGLKKLAWDPASAARVEPDGPIGSVYDDLIERLADTHEVIAFAFDWRRPIEDEARRLAAAVDAALGVRAASQQPVRLIAHSMGGLVARTMQLEKPDTWKRLMAREGSRFLMLGTPNGGSWAPMQTLSGDDTFGNALVAFGSLFDNGGARKMMAGMPGFIQLQASLLDPSLALDKAETWQKLADADMQALRDKSMWHDEGTQRTVYEWGAPPQAVLDQAVALRRRLDAQVPQLAPDAEKILLVVGHASFTPNGYVMGSDGLEYTNVPDDGDGRVPLWSALLPGVRTWKVDAEHGKLPDVAAAFPAYVELLTTGTTRQLDTYEAPAARGARGAAITPPPAALVRSRPSHGLQGSRPPSSGADVLGTSGDTKRAAARTTALEVGVLNADLQFVPQPLLVGHYRSITLTGAEAVVDRLVAGGMSRALAAGLYPDAVGSHQIFGNHRSNPDNPFELARPAAAVVVGLGEEGKLREADLSLSVRQAVLAFAQRLSEQEGSAPAQFELAATLMGSGGTGISPGGAARAIAQGALDANQRLQENGWPVLGRLTLVELYLERAGDAWRALQLQQTATPQRIKLIGKVETKPGQGALRRSLDSSYRGAAYDYISALRGTADDDDHPTIAFILDTKRARTEVRAQRTQGTLLRQLVATASNDANTDKRIGRTLFNLLVPVEVEPFLGGASEMVIEVEPETAGIPWELLDTNPDAQTADQRPWAIRSKLVRKLRTEAFRAQVNDATPEDNVLVVGEPACDPAIYPPLDGARTEAIAVAAELGSSPSGLPAERITSLVDRCDAQAITNALFEKRYRVVHIAGHGEPGPNGGVVLSGKNTYLGASEVKAMRTVPELVFLNCCHLAGRDAAATLATPKYDRAAFAANIAEALIEVGVRCVIAAGWAVEDEPAKQFATAFYANLLNGGRFIEAVGAARAAAWRANPSGNTWAAYQCYGDPEWTWRRAGADAQRPAAPIGDEFASVASPVALSLALETLATRSAFSGAPRDLQLDKLRYLESEFGPVWGAMGAIAEAFGVAYAAVGATDAAIGWYRRAVDAEDGSASMRAAEQYGNQLVRRAEEHNDAAGIRDGIAHLERLVALQPTVERESLLGSAYKRLTMVETRAKHAGPAQAALDAAVQHYSAAEAMAAKTGSGNLFYPAKNALSCEVRRALLQRKLPQIDDARVAVLAGAMQKAAAEAPDFWSVVGLTELLILQAIGNGRLAGVLAGVLASLSDLKGRVAAPRNWNSVYNEALFTVEPYAAMAAPAEKQAAQKLVDALKAMAA